MENHYDIAIVGAGPVGASLARALSQQGLQLAIIDTKPRGLISSDQRQIALSHSSVQLFQGLKLWPELMNQVEPIQTVHVSHAGHFGSTRLTAKQARVPALGYVISMRVLLEVLSHQLTALPDVAWYSEATIKSIEKKANHNVIKFTSTDEIISASLIVAADGVQSKVRELLGIETMVEDYHQTALVGVVGLSRPHQGVAYERFTSNGPIALLPLQGQKGALVWCLPESEVTRVHQLSDDQCVTALQTCLGYRAGKCVSIQERALFPLKSVKAKQATVSGAVLIGNAAHTIHPVAAQGFNLGLRDVATLAQVIIEAHRCHVQLGDESILKRYVEWRRQDQREMTLFVDGIVKTFSNHLIGLRQARTLGLWAFDRVPVLRNKLLSTTLGILNPQPRLLCGVIP